MDDVCTLLNSVTKEEFDLEIGGVDKIVIHKKDFDEYKDVKNLNIHKCLDLFYHSFLVGNSNRPHMIVQTYKEWYKHHQDSQCGCLEVLGLYEYYELR